MKTYLPPIFLFLMFASSVFGQRSDVFDPIPVDLGFTPYQRYVPFEFLFLVNDDLTNVLFNTSNLANIEQSQVYTTITPGSNRNYRFAYLSRKGWFLIGSIRNNNDDDYSTRESSTIESTSVSGVISNTTNRISQDFFESTSDNSSNGIELRMAKLIGNSQNKSRSVGMLLGYQNVKDNNIRNSIYEEAITFMEFRNDTLLRTQVSGENKRDISSSNRSSDKFLIGIEYSSKSAKLITSHRLYAQYNDQENSSKSNRLFISENDIEYFLGTPAENFISQRILSSNSFQNYSPLLIGYTLYANRTMNWLGEDYVFAEIDAFYGFDNANISYLHKEERIEISNGFSENSLLRNIDVKDSKMNQYQGNAAVSFGYAVKLELEDLLFFTGISNSFSYIQHSGYLIQGNVGVAKFDDSFHTYAASMPVFGEYRLNEWISLLGGANLSVTYSGQNLKIKTTTPFVDTVVENERIQAQKSTRNNFRNTATTFFGLKASHKSGLKIMADINGDIARLNGWYFTVGYQF